jgi:uncharacterized membrane protein
MLKLGGYAMPRFLIASLLAVLLMAPLARPGLAQTEAQELTLSTAYPSQEVRAGESVSLSLDVRNRGLPSQEVELEVRNVPEGWRASFQGGGRVVHSVYVETDNARSVTLKVDVPDGAQGANRLLVVARGQGVEARLPLELVIGELAPPRLSLEVDLPVLRGSPTTAFSYRLRVKNESDEDLLVSFEYEAPLGFGVTFRRSGQEVVSLPIRAGATENIDASVNPRDQIAAGEYGIRVRALGGEALAELDLTVVITGRPTLSLSGPDGRLSGQATAGRETPLEIILRNTGTAPAEGIRLESSPPAQWRIAFEPQTVAALAPNEELKVTVKIAPPQQAVAGDYAVTLRAIPESGESRSAEFRITVMTSTLWGVAGLVLIAAALGVVALAVARFGRR